MFFKYGKYNKMENIVKIDEKTFPDKKNPENTRVLSKISPPVTINEYNASFKAIA